MDKVDPPPFRVAIMGLSGAGKTTLVEHLRTRKPSGERTQRKSFTVVALQSTPLHYVALLDAAGEALHQQLDILRLANMAIFVVDHNQSDVIAQVNRSRLVQHEEFLSQVMRQMADGGAEALRHVIVLANKADLWADDEGANQEMRSWVAGRANDWKHVVGVKAIPGIHTNHSSKHLLRVQANLSVAVRSWLEGAVD